MSNLDRFIALGAALLLLGAMPNSTTNPVRIDSGLISGTTDKSGVAAYLGIPFAAPPVGQLRWRPPQPAGHWEGVREADHFGASCVQNEQGSRSPITGEFMTHGAISEDCLFVNVWTVAKSASEKEAVMFYIYGGGFQTGSSSVAVINGAVLARRGVVVVTVNYRVGPLGFLVHPEPDERIRTSLVWKLRVIGSDCGLGVGA